MKAPLTTQGAARLRAELDEMRLVNEATLHAHDPFSKQPDYKKCAVRIEKA